MTSKDRSVSEVECLCPLCPGLPSLLDRCGQAARNSLACCADSSSSSSNITPSLWPLWQRTGAAEGDLGDLRELMDCRRLSLVFPEVKTSRHLDSPKVILYLALGFVFVRSFEYG